MTTESTENQNLWSELTWQEAGALAGYISHWIHQTIRRIRYLKGFRYISTKPYEDFVDELSETYWLVMQQFYHGPSDTQSFIESVIHQPCKTQDKECLNPDHCIHETCLRAERKAHEEASARNSDL
jgi:hypothetical protein